MAEPSNFRRAVILMTGTSLLVPLVGVATAPILAHALGVAGRGEAAAAMAPNVLIASVATLGLPEALTYILARRAYATRRAIALSSLFSAALGALCLAGAIALASFLAGGDPELADLIVLAAALAIPMLGVNLLRGAAFGRQLWTAVAVERVLNSMLRLVLLGGLALAGALDVLTAVLVMSLAPIVAGVAYWRLFLPAPAMDSGDEAPVRMAPALLGFGSRIWAGAVASMLTARLAQLVVTPLSGVEQLGLFVVAVTISDVPFIVSTAVRDVIFGVNSREQNAERLASTTRIATLVCFSGSLVLGASLPFWIEPVFGSGFQAATVPTWLLLLATVVNVPGWMAGAGLGAWNRPGLRSLGLLFALAGNFVGLLLFVPPFGASGAALAGILSGLAMSIFGVVATARVVRLPVSAFIWPRSADFRLLWGEARAMLARLRSRGNAASEDESRGDE